MSLLSKVMVRGGITLLHLLSFFGLVIVPGTHIHSPFLAGLPGPLPNKPAFSLYLAHLVLTLLLYWNLCLSDPGVTGRTGAAVGAPMLKRATWLHNPDRSIIGGV
jgi:hypothetical protein